MTIFLTDIDGTLADDRARKLKAGPEPSRDDREAYLAWLSFIQNEKTLSEDKPVVGMASLLRSVSEHSLSVVIYLTAREEKYRHVTKRWLNEHGFPQGALIMRPNESWLSSRELKEAHLLELKAVYRSTPIVAIDDDGSGDCAAMYRELGIPHLHVKLPPLKEAQEEEAKP